MNQMHFIISYDLHGGDKMDIRFFKINNVQYIRRVDRSLEKQKQNDSKKQHKSFEEMLKDAKEQKNKERDDK